MVCNIRRELKRVLTCLVTAVMLPSCLLPADDASKGVEYPSPLVLTDLKITLTRASLYIGQTTTAVAAGIDQFANPIATGPVTYTSSNRAVATISQDGVVSALAPGFSTIIASTATKRAETLLQVSAASVLTALHVSAPVVRVGFVSTATLTGEDQYGVPFAPTNVLWSTSAPSIATVSQDGVITGVAIGQTTINVQSQGVTATAAVNVISAAPTVQSVVLEGARRVKVGDEYVYTPIITLTDGMTANLPVTFGLAPQTDGLITSNGHFTPLRKGAIGINATVNNTTFTTNVLSYSWSTLYLFGSNAEVDIESDAPVIRAGVDRYPYLSVSCSATADPQYPEFNIGVG
ncbi:MAG: Ig-like domain-containing protein [Gemmatimonadota bacterium]|nr:Ig-like domain-containing protein [Gemmatimonadota bacterium]